VFERHHGQVLHLDLYPDADRRACAMREPKIGKFYSNGSTGMLDVLVRNSGLDACSDATPSASTRKDLQGEPDAYALIESHAPPAEVPVRIVEPWTPAAPRRSAQRCLDRAGDAGSDGVAASKAIWLPPSRCQGIRTQMDELGLEPDIASMRCRKWPVWLPPKNLEQPVLNNSLERESEHEP